MNPQLEKDKKNTVDIISANWEMQNNPFDRREKLSILIRGEYEYTRICCRFYNF